MRVYRNNNCDNVSRRSRTPQRHLPHEQQNATLQSTEERRPDSSRSRKSTVKDDAKEPEKNNTPRQPSPDKTNTRQPDAKKCPERRSAPRSNNPFILFFLSMHYKKPTKRVTEVARAAGRRWCQMTSEQKRKYIKLAQAESKRRQKKKWLC